MEALVALRGETIVHELFELLRGCTHLYDAFMEPVALMAGDAQDLLVCDKLGRVIGSLPNLKELRIKLTEGDNVAQAMALIVQHIRQVKTLHCKTVDRNTALSISQIEEFKILRAALAENYTIEHVAIRFDTQADWFAHLCEAFSVLPSLTDACLDTFMSGELNTSHVASIMTLINSKSLRNLDWTFPTFSSMEAATLMSRGIARSRLNFVNIQNQVLDLYGQDHIQRTYTLDVTAVLRSTCLRRLALSGVAEFSEITPARRLCQVLATTNLEELTLHELDLREGAAKDLGAAVCRPSMICLKINVNSPDCVFAELAMHLRNCPKLQVLRLYNKTASESTVLDILNGCSHCSGLLELKLPDLDEWTGNLDSATAQCLKLCRKLLKINIPVWNHGLWHCAELLSASGMHPTIEEVALTPEINWSPLLVSQLKRATSRNSETRRYRERFERLAGQTFGRAALSSALHSVRDKHDLVFLALTTNRYMTLFFWR
jgi:hypothetical protein